MNDDGIPVRSQRLLHELIEAYTVPLAVAFQGMVGPHCTAMLFQSGEKRFLITAAHAIRSARVDNDAQLFFPSDKLMGKAVRITTDWVWAQHRFPNKPSPALL